VNKQQDGSRPDQQPEAAVYQMRHILVPTDFSEHSVYAFSLACDLARQNQAELLLLHVAAPPGPEQVSFGEMARQQEPEHYYRRLLQEMRQLFPAGARDVPVQYLITEGEPVAEIDRVARARACDLIIVGTYGHNVLRRVLLGSTAEQLVRTAPCPVLVVKLPHSEKKTVAQGEQVELQPLSK
jgi:nucleotide-binding universal stress UspA family protein